MNGNENHLADQVKKEPESESVKAPGQNELKPCNLCDSTATWECVHGVLYCDLHKEVPGCSFKPAQRAAPSVGYSFARPNKVRLTPQECSEQFRMYARANSDNKDTVHHLNFCADFLEEFCAAPYVAGLEVKLRLVAEQFAREDPEKSEEFETDVQIYLRPMLAAVQESLSAPSLAEGQQEQDLAKRLARSIFASGDFNGDRCQRIQFRGGVYPDKETDQGGLNEASLVRVIQKALGEKDASIATTGEGKQ